MMPQFQIDAELDVPIYRQLHDQIRNSILSGLLVPGERLPATRDLAGLLGLNRTTVSAAYGLLESAGLIRGHVGRGSFVAVGLAPASGLDWNRLLDDPEEAPLAQPPASAPDGSISFATSSPSAQLFPMDDVRTTCREILAAPDAAAILQLGSPLGYAPLRRRLLEDARRTSLARAGDDLIVTNGCQQALYLLRRVLVRPGDTVALEDPVYPGLKSLFSGHHLHLLGVPVGPQGVDPEYLDRFLARERPRLLVVTPNFQNPTGATLPLAARQAILRAARQAGTVVVENDIYGDLRYEGDPLPTLKQMDPNGDVVLLRSFSKVAFPGLRVGWVTAPRPLIARLAAAKESADLHSDHLSQALLLRFLESGRLAAHKARMIAAGAVRLAAAIAACDRCLPYGSHFTRPQGGMNLWVRLPDPLDAGELLPEAQRAGACYLPGRYFAVSRHDPGTLRLSFAGLSPENIHAGLAILGTVFSKELERVRAENPAEPASAIV
jgi:2-aminoadipate transaminase